MAERSQTAPEAGLWGRLTRESAEAARLSWARGDRELEHGPHPEKALLVFARWGYDLGVMGQGRCVPL